MTDFLTGPSSPDPDHGPGFLPPTDSPDPALTPESTPTTPSSPHRIAKRSVLMACGALGLVGATIVGASALTGPSTQLLKGTVSLTDSDGVGGSKSSCYGEGGYGDLESGAQVTVKNGDDKMLATTTLGSGTGGGPWNIVYADNTMTDITCTFPFETKVPKGEKFYAVTIGSSGRRGTLSYSKDDLEKKDWTVSFTIG